MLSPGQYARAPILEAILAIDTEPVSRETFDAIRTLAFSRGDFPKHEEIVAQAIDFKTKASKDKALPQVQARARGETVAYAAASNDERKLVQLRRDGFDFHMLAPYTNWYDLRDAARGWWSAYREVTGGLPVLRLGLQYINRLEFPLEDGRVDFKDFLKTFIEVSAETPNNGFSNYFLRVELPQNDLNAIAVVQQGILPRDNPGRTSFVPVLMEIAIHRIAEIPQEETEIWNLLEQFRVRKNEIFAASLTDRMKELIS